MTKDVTTARYPDLLAEIGDGSLLRLEPGDRLWKLYFLRPGPGQADRVEHRIYTKEQRDGHIGLVSYNLRLSPGGQPVRSNLAYARDIPKDTLDQVIWNVVRASRLGPEEVDVIDLSKIATLDAQLVRLRGIAPGEE